MLLFLDIETIPGPIKPDVSEVKVPANYKDEAKIRAYQEEHLEEAWRRQALDSMSGSIICIGYALEDGPVTTFCVEDEAKVVSDFAALVGELQGRYSEPLNWCGWNIATFDLPWLWRKAVKYGLARLRNAIPRDNPYGMIVDLMRVWDADQRRLRHILFTPLDDVDHGANWEGDVTKARLALGWHDFRHRIILHPGDWRTAGICGQSDAARVPLRAVKPLGPAPEAREEPSAPGGMAIGPASVRISAFYETDRGFVLRLYECAGETTEARVILPAPFLKAARTDFNLEPLDAPVILDEAELRLPLRPWEIATIKLVR